MVKQSNFQLVQKHLGLGQVLGDQGRHWITPSKVDSLLSELRKELSGLGREQISSLLNATDNQLTLSRFVRPEFQLEGLSQLSSAVPTPDNLTLEQMAVKVARVLNPVTDDEGEVLGLDDLSADLQIRKVKLAADTLRETFLMIEETEAISLVSAIEEYQRKNYYQHIESDEGVVSIPMDKYFARFHDMIQYGLGVSNEEAEELEVILLRGIDVSREAQQLHFKLSRLQGYYLDDDFTPNAQEKFSQVLTDVLSCMPEGHRTRVFKHLQHTVFNVVRDLRREALQLPPSPQKKSLLSMLNGTEESIWAKLGEEKLAALAAAGQG